MEERNGSANSPLYLQGIEPPQPNGVVGRSGGTTRENGSEASDSDASRARKATVVWEPIPTGEDPGSVRAKPSTRDPPRGRSPLDDHGSTLARRRPTPHGDSMLLPERDEGEAKSLQRWLPVATGGEEARLIRRPAERVVLKPEPDDGADPCLPDAIERLRHPARVECGRNDLGVARRSS